jgi:hypothetical protein
MKQENDKNEIRKSIPGRWHFIVYNGFLVSDNAKENVEEQ